MVSKVRKWRQERLRNVPKPYSERAGILTRSLCPKPTVLPRSKQCLERRMTQMFEAKPGDRGGMVDLEKVISQC